MDRLNKSPKLVQSFYGNGTTPLTKAISEGDVYTTELLLRYGIGPNEADGNGCTPLAEAVSKGHREIVKLLLYYGASPDLKGRSGCTPLELEADDIQNLPVLPVQVSTD